MLALIYRRRRATVPPYLQFTTQPGGATSGSAFSPQPVVTAKNPDGTTKTSFTGNVTLAVNTVTGSHSLGGTVTVAAVAGVATFSGVTDTGSGDGTLTASATGYSSATSASFTTAGGVTTLAADNFNRTGATIGTASDGGTWGGGLGANFTTDGAVLHTSTANVYASRNVGQADYTFSVKIVNPASCHAGLRWRMADTSNYLELRPNDATHYYVAKKVAGVDTNYFTKLVAVAAGDTVTVITSGTNHTIKVNGTVAVPTWSEATDLTTGTLVALSSYGSVTDGQWDDFLVTT